MGKHIRGDHRTLSNCSVKSTSLSTISAPASRRSCILFLPRSGQRWSVKPLYYLHTMPSSRPTSNYDPAILAIAQSPAYPSIPPLPELEALLVALQTTSQNVAAELERRQRKDKKRKEKEEEQAALEANAQTGAKLEALERTRVENQRSKESPSSVRVKKERTSCECLVVGHTESAVSPAPSNASSASFKPPLHQPITYGSAQNKKKKKRVVDSDEERCELDLP